MDYTPTSPIILARWVWWLTGSTTASRFFSMWRGEDLGTACTYVRSRAVALSYAVYALRVRERLGRQDPSPLGSKSIRPRIRVQREPAVRVVRLHPNTEYGSALGTVLDGACCNCHGAFLGSSRCFRKWSGPGTKRQKGRRRANRINLQSQLEGGPREHFSRDHDAGKGDLHMVTEPSVWQPSQSCR